jgi:ribonuclease P protein component
LTLQITTIKKRSDFLLAAKSGFKFVKPTIVVQIRKRNDDSNLIRVGFTATKKIGNAVIRNRTKRRMRVLAHKYLKEFGVTGCDYVFIGRDNAYKADFVIIINDVKHSLKRLASMINSV